MSRIAGLDAAISKDERAFGRVFGRLCEKTI